MKIWEHEEIVEVTLKVFAINMQKRRIKQDISFEDLSNKTKININKLKKIEYALVKDVSVLKLFLISKALKTKLSEMFCL